MLRFLKGLLPVLTSLLFAGSFIAGKYTTVDLGPLTTSLLRYLIATLTLGILVWQSGEPPTLKVERQDWLPMILLGTFGVVGYHYFFFSSLSHTVVANTAIINAFNPVVTGMLAAAFIRERLRGQQYLGGAIALSGVLTLLTRGDLVHLLELRLNRGDLLMLCAVFCWAIYALLIKHLSQRHSGLIITFYAAVSGVLQLLVLAGLERWWQELATLSFASLLSILYMGVAASGVGYLLFNLSVLRIGPTRTASVVYSSVPVFVSILAWLFFREPVTPVMIASMGLILLGLNFVLR
ncbi:MAG TPA: DMT family transporter [Trichocoleus sp.]